MLFHNMRASRETELAKVDPLDALASWMGNTAVIAMKHYITARDLDFKQASQCGALHNPVQQEASGPEIVRYRSQATHGPSGTAKNSCFPV